MNTATILFASLVAKFIRKEFKTEMAKILELAGKAAFIVGVVFAIVGGIWGGRAEPTNEAVIILLLIAGIVIGLLNITAKEATAVLAATTALIILALWGHSGAFNPVMNLNQTLGENLVGMVDAFALLMAPAAIIIAVRAVIKAARHGD